MALSDTNHNIIFTTGFSNPVAQTICISFWEAHGKQKKSTNVYTCQSCSFYARFGFGWGLCCNSKSPHFKETVHRLFLCDKQTEEGCGPHSFCEEKEDHCRCGGYDIKRTITYLLRDLRNYKKHKFSEDAIQHALKCLLLENERLMSVLRLLSHEPEFKRMKQEIKAML